MRELLDYQADQIERVLASHGVPGRVYGGSVTARLVEFHVAPAAGVKIARIEGLAEELAMYLGVSACRVQRRGAVELAATVGREAPGTEHRQALQWEWIAGHAHPERRFDEAAVRSAQSSADLVGYLNYIHPYRVQILGSREVAYLHASAPEDQERRISRIVTLEPPVLIVADAQTPPDRLIAMCDRASIPLFVTAESAGHVIDVVRGYLGQHFAERTTRHGVFMDILGLGVLLTGESGLGKSELALELISRGHGLVADDAVDIYRISQTALEGRCPELLQNLLEVRGIGLLDIKAIFGETAVRRKMRVQLIVHLVRKETMERDYGVQIMQAWGMTESLGGSGAMMPPGSDELPFDQRIDGRLKSGNAMWGVDYRLVDDEGREVPQDGKSHGHLRIRAPWAASAVRSIVR